MTQEKFTFPRHGMDKDTTIGTSLEEAISKVSRCTDEIEPLDGFTVNPTVEIIGGEGELDFFLVFRHPETNEIEARRATPEELIALKVISGDLDPVEASEEAGCKPAVIDRAIWSAVESGVILAPRPRLVREPFTYPEGAYTEGLLATRVFSLQWHITQVCDLHCKHCYDRSDRVALTLERAQFVLEDLRSFCHKSGVRGHVCFSGGKNMKEKMEEMHKTSCGGNMTKGMTSCGGNMTKPKSGCGGTSCGQDMQKKMENKMKKMKPKTSCGGSG